MMMFFLEGEFFEPTKKMRHLILLDILSQNPSTRQNILCKYTKTSNAMVNKYLHELRSDGLIEFVPVDKKSIMYKLTAVGVAEKDKLMKLYQSELAKYYELMCFVCARPDM
jgi:predicted transcriptional regulator